MEITFSGRVTQVTLVLLFAIAVSLLSTIALSSGKADFCYVKSFTYIEGPAMNYELYEHVPWRPDRVVSRSTSVDDVKRAAEQFNCEIR